MRPGFTRATAGGMIDAIPLLKYEISPSVMLRAAIARSFSARDCTRGHRTENELFDGLSITPASTQRWMTGATTFGPTNVSRRFVTRSIQFSVSC